MVTTWACLTEAMHILHRNAGWPAQDALWAMVDSGSLLILDLDIDSRKRTRNLMARYRDHPMDMGDATLVALAEVLRQRTVFTLDAHFHAYLLHDRQAISVVP